MMTAKMNSKVSYLNNGLLFARPLHDNAVMAFSTVGVENKYHIEKEGIRDQVILISLDKIELRFNGEWFFETVTMSQATTLFSFLDFQTKSREESVSKSNGEAHSVILQTGRSLAMIPAQDKKTFIGTLISSMLNPQKCQLEHLFSFVRNVESYWISSFLLSQVMNEDKDADTQKIYNASKLYGVSESYFRKLCHHAFTRGPKKQLRLWRAAYSALQLIENDNSIAMVAGDNGYASSSHFSTEIKSLFGMTPREFKKLEGLLHE
ncbi:TPA: helix-turn-helix domain-containing protein [Klebsiella aerogenes]|nr:helix-turn-helix domain-containing protein [Klebsiella aerogenes]ELA0209151.1 helix-turn-helix domain-containing protein [Klebsiella aerogenes]ELA0225273.1 helix-turn-helix domain-containing protein [Klebsiella aerogenes]ELA0230255.1 helix-turn-helix domain-containing protein [Klebsiella aerogenes]HBR7000856.1 helix-turn-helix domain-containing protein [Klebsiella aerogenes]